MRSIKRRFRRVTTKYAALSSLICFRMAIMGQEFTKAMMRRWFYKLVDKTDYDKKDKKEVFADLERVLKSSYHDKK